MQLMIDIPEETFKYYVTLANKGEQLGNLEHIILDGTPLKGESEDCISREEAIRVAEQGQVQGYEWQFKKLCNLPSVTPQQTRWIPISERLPNTDGIFLTYIVNPYDTKLSYVMICDYVYQKWCPFDDSASSNVIAWMPLPEPYKESEE